MDNIFVFEPLPYVKKMYYMDVNFYRYYIGRADQSVNEQVMIGRIDQQLKVNKIMVDYVVSKKQFLATHKKLRNYMLNYLDIITTVSSIMLIYSGVEENLEKKMNSGNISSRKILLFSSVSVTACWEAIPTCRAKGEEKYPWRGISFARGFLSLISGEFPCAVPRSSARRIGGTGVCALH